MDRRGILKAIGIAPAIAPDVARSVTQPRDLSTEAIAPWSQYGENAAFAQKYPPAVDEREIYTRNIAEFFSDKSRKQRRYNARERIRCLDLDLASMRSVSPAFAVTRQVDREVKVMEEAEGGWLREQAMRFGIPWIG